MHKHGDALLLSASDLVGHLNCGHLTSLDLEVANGTLARPAHWDPLLELLRARGTKHELGFIEHLQTQGRVVTVIEGVGGDDAAVAQTLAAMLAGDEIIVQGALRAHGFVGRVDVLLRVDTQSGLGAWSYEVVDTKLARETKAGTVLQLCLYAALLEASQGKRPDTGYVVAPWTGYALQPYRMDQFGAYYRYVRQALESAVVPHAAAVIYPEPKAHCEVCRWQARCDAQRRADDHLSLVAGISKAQIDEFISHGITTLAGLAAVPPPLPWKPKRGSALAYERVREQARIQFVGRQKGVVLHELLPITAGFGLATLPAPSAGDIFLDLEGDPFVGEGGLEYLFGYCYRDTAGTVYVGDWAVSREEEKQVFERFVDFVMQRLTEFPDLHIYHFAPYEPAALKRLMGRYAVREEEIDTLLRGRCLVDLYAVVRQSLRASVESYSIKKLEPLYGFTRATPLPEANRALTKVQAALELGDLELLDADTRTTVARYNRDDCESTRVLRDWLEAQRGALIQKGTDVPRPGPPDAAPSEALGEWQAKIAALVAQLTQDVPVDLNDRNSEQHARWLLAHTLDFHRREHKAVWWEHYRLAALTADELLDERAGVSGLSFDSAQGGTAKAPIHRYTFPPQEGEVRSGDDLRNLGGEKFGAVHAISWDARWVDIKKRQDTADVHPEAVYRHKVVDAKVLAQALVRLGEYVVAHGIEGAGMFQAARDLLLRLGPRLGTQTIQIENELALDAACRLALALEGGILPIQGPPGSGKTFTGARMICALVQAGKKVGVCATSHKVIRHLLDEVIHAADEAGFDVQCVQKPNEMEDDVPHLRFAKTAEVLFSALATGAHVAGGTAWLWASPAAAEAVDVLFVDEAAQMALANVLAVGHAAPRLVLLGDPQQLDQPIQGSHPEGTEVSALHHVLGMAPTIAADRGLFLAETWRLHPAICDFTSEMFYSSRLHPRPGLEGQTVTSPGRVSGTGLRFLAVHTHGNQSSSPEEADAVKTLVEEVLGSNTTWTDKHGTVRPVTLSDILVIAPYNAQVAELGTRLPPGARIGTVDKFQGQEAPIVIYSMTTSSHADAPRGMEFLYSLNRLNVATSRAKCVCVLVASPSVFEVSCRTPRQMQLANAFCRYLEMATPIA
ncbi:TM0106 family RecB-like putative nuclease [Lysobacter solisilvae (ex Woo and Kim 2020)]|uniref:TM0106 family RecB-like putative nuclease n=1 Tax=Agrilutibacter terrestris TaxID=2865112 RepID=A0A7H0G001_9GAMM|nr:TM0106 family RecB-like putative nuclease [Lysobacter terrestris]QNP41617.1 TM0106 family RecB-like putative nuclease [Lysobacter terrestris]